MALVGFPLGPGWGDAELTLSGTTMKTAGPSRSHTGSTHVSGCDVKQLADWTHLFVN